MSHECSHCERKSQVVEIISMKAITVWHCDHCDVLDIETSKVVGNIYQDVNVRAGDGVFHD